jgi:hypothetical protein
MIRTAFFAACIVALGAGSAAALPAAPSSGAPAVEQSNIVQVQHRKKHMDRRHHSRRDHRWDRRHHAGPRGWHRYSSRPWNWQTRGCTAIGPVWFCP